MVAEIGRRKAAEGAPKHGAGGTSPPAYVLPASAYPDPSIPGRQSNRFPPGMQHHPSAMQMAMGHGDGSAGFHGEDGMPDPSHAAQMQYSMHGMPPGMIYPPMPGRYPPLGQMGQHLPHGPGMPPQDHDGDLENGGVEQQPMQKRARGRPPGAKDKKARHRRRKIEIYGSQQPDGENPIQPEQKERRPRGRPKGAKDIKPRMRRRKAAILAGAQAAQQMGMPPQGMPPPGMPPQGMQGMPPQGMPHGMMHQPMDPKAQEYPTKGKGRGRGRGKGAQEVEAAAQQLHGMGGMPGMPPGGVPPGYPMYPGYQQMLAQQMHQGKSPYGQMPYSQGLPGGMGSMYGGMQYGHPGMLPPGYGGQQPGGVMPSQYFMHGGQQGEQAQGAGAQYPGGYPGFYPGLPGGRS